MSEVDSEFGGSGGTTGGDLLLLAALQNVSSAVNISTNAIKSGNTITKSIESLTGQLHVWINHLVVRVEQLTRHFERFMRLFASANAMNVKAVMEVTERTNKEHNEIIFKQSQDIQAFYNKITNLVEQETSLGEKIKGGIRSVYKSAQNMAKAWSKQLFLKAIKQFTGMAKQFIQLAKSPIDSAIMQVLGALGSILNVILVPLKPFLFFLELLASVLEAALAPLTEAIWEELTVVFEELVSSIPILQQQVLDWIEANGGMEVMMSGIIASFRLLIQTLTQGDLMTKILNISWSLVQLVMSIIQPGTINMLFELTEMFLKLGEVVLPVVFNILKIITDIPGWALYTMGFALAGLIGMMTMGLPGLVAGPLLWGATMWPLLSMAEGGEVVPIIAHAGETIHSKGADADMLDRLDSIERGISILVKHKQNKVAFE